MNRTCAVSILAVASVLVTLAGLAIRESALLATAAFLVFATLVVELLGPDTEAEAARYRNHQARKGVRRTRR